MSIETLSIPGIPLPVSRIALGTWAIGGWKWGGSDADESVATIQAAVDRGINFLDTAPVYGFGCSEELVGRALAGGRRQRAVIATKVGVSWSDGKLFRDSRPACVRQSVEESLRRLQTDYIDLYQVHWPDALVPFEETAAELERLRRAGKILAIGVSNFSPAQMQRFSSAAQLSTVQPPYNLFERAIDQDVLPYARGTGLTVLAYGALCRGLLSGRITDATRFEGDDLRGYDPKFQEPRRSQYLAAVHALDQLARDIGGQRVLALAVRWVLDRGKTVALWGARRPEQLEGMEQAFGWNLSPQQMQQIDAIVAGLVTDPVGPEFMAPPLRAA